MASVYSNIDTVGDLIAALQQYNLETVIEVYDDAFIENRGVTLMHLEPDAEERADGSYEVVCVCADTLPSHQHAKTTS